MKLSEQDRSEMVEALIANEGSEEAGPWTEEDRELLNNMSDEKLVALEESRQASIGCQEAAQAALQGFRDAEGGSHIFNEETRQWESRFKPKPKPQPTVINAAPQPMTEQEWFDAAPASVQAIVNSALKKEEQEKKALVEKLIGNARAKGMSKDEIQRHTENLWKLSKDALEDQVALLIPEQTLPKRPDFIGASVAPIGNVSGPSEEFDADDYLPLPTINWQEAAAEQRQR